MSKPAIALIAAAILIILNLNSFRLMRRDKQAAKRNDRRVPEKTLFLAAGLFGGLGGVLGMQLLRHKTKHWYFNLFFSLFLIAQTAAVVCGAICLFK